MIGIAASVVLRRGAFAERAILPAPSPFPSKAILSATCYWHYRHWLLYYIMSVCCMLTAARGLVQRVVLVMCQRGRSSPLEVLQTPKQMNTSISEASMAICHMWIGVVAIGGVWMGATAAEIAMVYNCEMRAQNQVEAPFGQRTSVGGFEKVSIEHKLTCLF